MVQNKEPNTSDKQLVSLQRVLQTLREEENSDVLIDTVINYLRSELNYSLIWIGLYDRIEHRLVGKGGVTPGRDIAFLRQRFALNPGDLLEQVVIQQRPKAVPDLRNELRSGEWRKIAETCGIQGTVIFPVRHRDRCYGVTLLGSTLWGASPRSDEQARLSIVLGALAAALYQIEETWQRQQVKHPEQPLLTLLNRLRSLTGLGARLEAIVEETHQFLEPTRTSVYWFERERRYFWRRVGNRQKTTGFSEANQPASGITAQEVSGFYQALINEQVVSIGEAHSSLKGDTTTRLMQQMRARSLLAAPILYQNDLLGFLAVEGNDPRIWQEQEKNFIRAAAQLVALTAPLNEMEATIDQIRLDRSLTAEIAQAIASEEDWKTTLQQTADRVCQRLKAERFVVLLYDCEAGKFDLCYQNQPVKRRPLTPTLDMLNDADWKMLQKSQESVGVENLDGDLRLLAWRDRFLEAGIKSLLVASTTPGRLLEGLVIVCHESPRTWNGSERELLQVIAQQVGVVLHQWQLQRQTEQQEKINQTIQWGLTSMQQTHQIDRLERSALQNIAKLLQVPLVALVTWTPGRDAGRLITAPAPNDRFALNADSVIPIQTDPLIQWALQSDQMIPLEIEDTPPETRQWLNAPDIGQLLVLALRTAPEHEPTGITIIGDRHDRHWSERHLKALGTLVSQLAWCRRYLTLTTNLLAQREDLERLTWYKHIRLEDLYRSLLPNLKRLSNLNNPKDPLFLTRYQQILRQIQDVLAPIAKLLQEEQWRLRNYSSNTVSLITLLKRALERVDQQIKQRHLWSQVHNETNLLLSGDVGKLELALYQLLLIACDRSKPGGRIDLWCRQVDNHWLELSITDNGDVDTQLLAELESGRPADLLLPSPLDQPPGLHLFICQTLIKQIGGECNFYKLEDGRILSRLVLPLAGKPTPSPPQ